MVNQEDHLKELLKLVMLSQCWLEQLDKVRDNRRVNKQSLKNLMNRTEKELERVMQDTLLNLYNEDESTYERLKEGIEWYTTNIVDNTIEYALGEKLKTEE